MKASVSRMRLLGLAILMICVLLAFTGCKEKEFEVETKLKKDKIILEFENDTGSDMVIGWAGGESRITTSKKVYKEKAHMNFSIPEGNSEIEIDTSDFSGKVEKIELKDISCLNSRGLPEEKISNLVVYDRDKNIDGYDGGFSPFDNHGAKSFLIMGIVLTVCVIIAVIFGVWIHNKNKKAMAQFAPFAPPVSHGAGEDRVDDGFMPPPVQ